MAPEFAPHWSRWFNKRKSSFSKWHWIARPVHNFTHCGVERSYFRAERLDGSPPAGEVCGECARRMGGLATMAASREFTAKWGTPSRSRLAHFFQRSGTSLCCNHSACLVDRWHSSKPRGVCKQCEAIYEKRMARRTG